MYISANLLKMSVCPYELPADNFQAAPRILSKFYRSLSECWGNNWSYYPANLIIFGFLGA